MKKRVQNQICELFDTVKDAVKHIRKLPEAEDAHTVLVDCFAAVKSGEDALKGQLSEERFAFYEEKIAALKDALEDANDALSGGGPFNPRLKKAEAITKKICYELKREAEITIEIVFLPYKASMWDSFASIYRAAKDDPRCECHVVPIPYYERNTDHSFGRLVYEGDLFPSDVPTLHYGEYPLELMKPDIIFIHNPYDDNNYVTSVHPAYYTFRLRECTDFLVYVPYYVLGLRADNMTIRLPSLENVDCVVVQSQEIAKAYREFTPPQKIAVLGSPKFDEVFYYQKNPPEIPEEWRQIISGKKVVLYNTSLGSLLKGGEQYLKKLRNVFDAFESQDSLVLLWRPHPLSQNTIASMRPQLADEYLGLRDEYIRKGFGILDESADVHRVIEISDFYYGDPSSLMFLFGATGKPVIYQDINICPFDGSKGSLELRRFHFDCGDKTKSKIHFSTKRSNALFEADLQEGNFSYKGLLPGDNSNNRYGIMHDLAMIDGKMIFASQVSRELVLYDTATGESEYFPFETAYLGDNDSRWVSENCFIFKDSLFVIPLNCGAIIEFNIKNKSIRYHSNCLKALTDGKEALGMMACVYNGKALIPVRTSNKVMEFDPQTGKSRLIEIGDEAGGWYGIVFDGELFWLLPCSSVPDTAQNAIARWNYKDNTIKKFREYPAGFSIQKFFLNCIPFLCAENHGENMIFIPRDANMAVRINKNTEKVTVMDGLPSFKDNHTVSFPFSYPIIRDDDLYIYARHNETFYKINLNTQDVETTEFRTSNDDDRKIGEDIFNTATCNNDNISGANFQIAEGQLPLGPIEFFKSLPAGIRSDRQVDIMRSYAANFDGTSGEKILEFVLKNSLA